MILVGWGKNAKHEADLGIMKCSNCSNYAPFVLITTKRKATLYFIPVAKWDKKYYMMCGVCEAGLEMDEEKAQELIREVISYPSNDLALEIFSKMEDKISSSIEKLLESETNTGEEFVKTFTDKVIENAKADGYQEKDINCVISVFMEHAGSQLLPKKE